MIALLLLVAGCDSPPRLPSSALDSTPPPHGQMVAAGKVRGFLARPGAERPPVPGELRLVARLDGQARSEALATASDGRIVLAIDPTVDTAPARAYLAGLPAIGTIRERCLRETCP